MRHSRTMEQKTIYIYLEDIHTALKKDPALLAFDVILEKHPLEHTKGGNILIEGLTKTDITRIYITQQVDEDDEGAFDIVIGFYGDMDWDYSGSPDLPSKHLFLTMSVKKDVEKLKTLFAPYI